MDYQKILKVIPKKTGNKAPFTVKEKRFKTDDKDIPGAGTYDHNSSIEIKNPHLENASFISKSHKAYDIVMNKENPGIGEYDI